MIQKKNTTAIVCTAALAFGVGILLTFLLSPRALVLIQAIALVAAGSAFFLCHKK